MLFRGGILILMFILLLGCSASERKESVKTRNFKSYLVFIFKEKPAHKITKLGWANPAGGEKAEILCGGRLLPGDTLTVDNIPCTNVEAFNNNGSPVMTCVLPPHGKGKAYMALTDTAGAVISSGIEIQYGKPEGQPPNPTPIPKSSPLARFRLDPQLITDTKSGLIWTRNADLPRRELTLKQAYEFVSRLNKQKYGGRSDWRVPTVKEFDDAFDFNIWKKDLATANKRLATNMRVANFRSGFYVTRTAHMEAIRGGLKRNSGDAEQTNLSNGGKLRWWSSKAYLWPVAGGTP